MSPTKKFYRNGRLPEENRLAIGWPVGITVVPGRRASARLLKGFWAHLPLAPCPFHIGAL